MKKLVLFFLTLFMGYAIWAIVSMIFVFNAILPVVVAQAIDNAMMMLMLELIALVCFLTITALVLTVHITPHMVLSWPEWLVFGGGLLMLFGVLKELMGRSP